MNSQNVRVDVYDGKYGLTGVSVKTPDGQVMTWDEVRELIRTLQKICDRFDPPPDILN